MTRTVPRSRLSELLEPSAFLWATGIEDTFVFEPQIVTGRTLDEYELTEHYERWHEDLRLMAELGVGTVRYGIPWYKVCPMPGKWDWSFPDKAFDRLGELGIDPIVDLVHYGTPLWLTDSFLDRDFPKHMAEFAAMTAQRYKGRVRWYTPLNEPRITARYCGKLGLWPPYRRSWEGFVAVMLAVCKGVALTNRALSIVDPEIVKCHVDATDLFVNEHSEYATRNRFEQDIVFLALDLITARVDRDHSLHKWLSKHGALERDLEWFLEHPTQPDVIGINLYPMYSLKRLDVSPRGVRYRMPYASSEVIDSLARMYWDRYERPLMITETASEGSVLRRSQWMADSIEAVRRVRESGIPLVGYTWWPMFSLVAWSYRNSDRPMGRYLMNMGLWDLDSRLDRIPTTLVDEFREAVASGSDRVGRLRQVAHVS